MEKQWIYSNKNIYIKGYDAAINVYKVKDRISKLGGKVVTISENIPIDIIVYSDDKNLNKENKALDKLLAKFKKSQNISSKILDQHELLASLGFDPNPKFVLWTEYPNFDPFTGEKLELWNEEKVQFNKLTI